MVTSPTSVVDGLHSYCVDWISEVSSTPSWLTSSPIRIAVPPAAQFGPDGSASTRTSVDTPPQTFVSELVSPASSTPLALRSNPTSIVWPPPGHSAELAGTTTTSCCNVDGGSHT